jgi:DNA-binding protein H-NS
MNDKPENEEVPSTSRLNFGSKVDNDVAPAEEAQEDTSEVDTSSTQLDEVIETVEAAEAEPEVEEVAAVVEDEAETEFEPEIVTGEDDDGPVEIEIEAPAATTDGDDGKSVEELTAERERLDNEIKSKTDAQKTSVINQIKTVVETYAITTEELVEALGGLKSRRKGVKAKQKYADPASGATWSGRGKEPAWIKGKDRKKFLIPEDQQTVNP